MEVGTDIEVEALLASGRRVAFQLKSATASKASALCWRRSVHVTCGLTACTPASAPGPTLGNEFGKTLPFSGRRELGRRQLR